MAQQDKDGPRIRAASPSFPAAVQEIADKVAPAIPGLLMLAGGCRAIARLTNAFRVLRQPWAWTFAGLDRGTEAPA